MAFLVTHDTMSGIENNKLDFKKGRAYKCNKDYFMANGGFSFTKGETYKCTKDYFIPCDNGTQLNQFRLIGTERMFTELKDE